MPQEIKKLNFFDLALNYGGLAASVIGGVFGGDNQIIFNEAMQGLRHYTATGGFILGFSAPIINRACTPERIAKYPSLVDKYNNNQIPRNILSWLAAYSITQTCQRPSATSAVSSIIFTSLAFLFHITSRNSRKELESLVSNPNIQTAQ